MKRSEINSAYQDACRAFAKNGWHLPPNAKWDITDCGLGRFDEVGLSLVNLAEEKEYCEKLMYARENQVTPLHTHKQKKEDIICRNGRLLVELWTGFPEDSIRGTEGRIQKNGEWFSFTNGTPMLLKSGDRVTITPGIYHSFWPIGGECVIGEVSTANDDTHDNFFVDPEIGRYPELIEDVPSKIKLLWETAE